MKKSATAIVSCLTAMLVFSIVRQASAEEIEKVQYTVSFVNALDYEQKIFNTQSGAVVEGSDINVTYPNQIFGNDGYMWTAVLNSPQRFTIYQSGTHKYYIEYKQGEKLQEPEDPENSGKEKLEKWLQAAWKADCDITGQDFSGSRDPFLIVSTDMENNSRIKNLVSMIKDNEWHYFYMIGKNYVPKTLVIGTDFDAAYSSAKADTFSIGSSRYQVVKVGVRRNWSQETCVHEWKVISAAPESCLVNGTELCRCEKCGREETTIVPASGHADKNQDSLCDRCKQRTVEQALGDVITTILKTSVSDRKLSFTCIDTDYNGTGKMLYLADEVLNQEVTGTCFNTGEGYNDSSVRSYFNRSFVNNSSLGTALQPIIRPDGDDLTDSAVMLSKAEYETYRGRIKKTDGYFLRTFTGAEDEVLAVKPDGSTSEVSAGGNISYGVRPLILLEKPLTGETAEPRYWKEGDVQMRRIGKKMYRFVCVDEDYSDSREGHRKAALFLCDSIIRSDIDSNSFTFKTFSYGMDNNYKLADIRKWLADNSLQSDFNTESVYIGVNRAYTGSTKAGTFEQLTEDRLVSHDIGFQLMQDRLFSLSLEEALKYKDYLWKFNGSGKNNPESQISPYSSGYYLRTPFYAEDSAGTFRYSDDIYVVDLSKGNIHTAKTDSTMYGLRPAFALPQE